MTCRPWLTTFAPILVGPVLEPYCAPDGSVVMYQKPSADGSYDGGQASLENCP